MLDQSLYLAPIAEPAEVLDIGTGTGVWAIHFARQHPTSHVTGTDISLIQPRDNIPPNCTFEREDCTDEWMFEHKFDYIHWRLMLTCFNEDEFKALFLKIYDNLKSGGCRCPPLLRQVWANSA